MVTFRCRCGSKVEADDWAVGSRVTCPGCHSLVTVPGAPASNPHETAGGRGARRAGGASESPSSWMLRGCGLLLIAGLTAAIGLYFWAKGRIREYEAVVNRQISMAEQGDWSAAYEMMAPSYRNAHSQLEFQGTLEASGLLGKGATFHGKNLTISSNEPTRVEGIVSLAGRQLVGVYLFQVPDPAKQRLIEAFAWR